MLCFPIDYDSRLLYTNSGSPLGTKFFELPVTTNDSLVSQITLILSLNPFASLFPVVFSPNSFTRQRSNSSTVCSSSSPPSSFLQIAIFPSTSTVSFGHRFVPASRFRHRHCSFEYSTQRIADNHGVLSAADNSADRWR